jgi:hypothetical protein
MRRSIESHAAMSNESEPLANPLSVLDELDKSLEDFESDYLNRLLLLLKATEQRAKMLSEEITRVMSQLGLSLRHETDPN